MISKVKPNASIEIANQINKELTSFKDCFGSIPEDLKDAFEKLSLLHDLLLKEDTYAVMGEALDYLKDRPFRLDDSTGRETNEEKLNRIRTQWTVAKHKILNSPDGPIKKFSSKKGIKQRKKELIVLLGDEFNLMSLEALRDNFLELLIEYEKANQIITAFQHEINFLGEMLTNKYLKSREQSVDSQVSGKRIKNKYDIDCKQAGLDLLKKTLNRSLVKTDFSYYVVIMEDTKLEPKNREISEWGVDGWPIASLRVFFNEKTGMKPSFSKKNAAEFREKRYLSRRNTSQNTAPRVTVRKTIKLNSQH